MRALLTRALLALCIAVLGFGQAQAQDAFALKARNMAARALAAPTQSRHFARTNGFSIVSHVKSDFAAGQGSTTTGGTFLATMRILHTNLAKCDLSSLATVFSNWAPSAGTEANVPLDLMVRSGVEPKGTVTDQTTNLPLWFTFRGAETTTLTRKAVLVSDELPVSILAGASFYTRPGITTSTTGGAYPRSQQALGGTAGVGQNTGEGNATLDYTTSGTTTANTTSGYSESLVLGRCANGKIAASINREGDSITAGSHDGSFGSNNGGWPFHATISWPGGSFGIAGEKERDTLTARGFLARSKLIALSTAVLDAYGTNDVVQGDSVATIQASFLASAFRSMSVGQDFIKSTILPNTTSTDGWFTTTGQTQAANEAVRLAVNSWLRDTSAAGFVAQANAQVAGRLGVGTAAVVDPCAGVEANSSGVLTLNGGFWLPAQSAVIATGTATAATINSITDSSKSFTVNAFKGYVVHITGGTGAGQVSSVTYNSATVINFANNFTTTPDATSTYRIFDGSTVDGVHPSTGSTLRAAAAVKPKIDVLMSRPVGFGTDLPPSPANDNEPLRMAA